MESHGCSPLQGDNLATRNDNSPVTSSHAVHENGVNSNSLDTNNSCSYEWHQNDKYVFMCFKVGSGLYNQAVNVITQDEVLLLTFAGVSKIQLNLFERVVPEATDISFKKNNCVIRLLKFDQSISWDTVEAQECDDEMYDGDQPEVIKVLNPKTNFIERNDDQMVYVYLYVTNIDKTSLKVDFCTDKFSVLFSTSDDNFLKKYSGTDEKSVFEWMLHTKGEIDPEICSYRLSAVNLEVKLRKTSTDILGGLSLTNMNSENFVLLKNTWVHASPKVDGQKASDIPPAPPAPPTFNELKKPSTLVSPSGKYVANNSRTSGFPLSSCSGSDSVMPSLHGMVGLDNIGNTCFMNSVLQCLVNCRELRDYFLDCNFQRELNKENPLGMGGKLAISFAILMKCLWSSTDRSFAPSKLKGVMSLKANQFSGFAQHDAQEFMVELLDGLHEDLNRIKKKPYIAEPPDLDGWTDNEAADESWRLHKMRNDSIIDDLFKGQFKSTLTCHECNKVSVKFDEFCCLSVPIPKDQKIIQVVFFWRDKSKQPKKFFVKVPADAFVDDLKQQLSLRTKISSSAIQVIETVKSKIHKIFGRVSTLSSIVPSDVLMAFEVLTEQEAGGPVVELAVTQRMMIPNPPNKCAACLRLSDPGAKLKRCTKCFRVGYCNTTCQKSHWLQHKPYCRLNPQPVGSPFILSLPESAATYTNLALIAENYARYSVDIFQPPLAQTQTTSRRRRRGSTSSGEASSDPEEMEIDSECDGREIRECEIDGGSYLGEDRAEADWPLSPGGAVGGPSRCSDRNNRSSSTSSSGSGGEEIPQLSSSPKGKTATPQRTLTSATRLFSLRPVSSKAQNMAPPHGEPFNDKAGNEPLDLTDTHTLAMDWCTNERLPVYCFIQNKDIDCEVELEDSVERRKHTSLEACIDLFTQPENLSEGDSWRCPRCKKPVEATKQMSVWRLPSMLIIQLKRFSFKYVLYSDKIDKFVQYPIRGLDMSPFLSEGSPEVKAEYDLFGVINHMGRLLGGHYTAYCRTVDSKDSKESEIDWRLCDDSRVNYVTESRVVHEQAYLLLYRRRGDTFELPRSLLKTPPQCVPEGGANSDESVDDSTGESSKYSSEVFMDTGAVMASEPQATSVQELD